MTDTPTDPLALAAELERYECEYCTMHKRSAAAIRALVAEESTLRRRALSAELDRDEALALLASERESYDGILRATRLALEMRVAERDTLVAKLKARREQAGDSTPPEVETP